MSRFHEAGDGGISPGHADLHADGSSAPGRPPGSTASSWIPVTHGLGAVIEQALLDRDPGRQSLPSVLGYFICKHEGHWLRLDSIA